MSDLTKTTQPKYFDPNGVKGVLKRGLDGQFYFIPEIKFDLWDIVDEFDIVAHSCGDFENAIAVADLNETEAP